LTSFELGYFFSFNDAEIQGLPEHKRV
jgi:hypothetical protein